MTAADLQQQVTAQQQATANQQASAQQQVTADQLFTAERSNLMAVAYRLLGTMSDAEDVLQDVFEKWLRADRSSIQNPAAYLTTMTTRAGIDRLYLSENEAGRYGEAHRGVSPRARHQRR